LRAHPVAEIFVDHSIGGSKEYSALLGAIWPWRENLALDVAGRAASLDGGPVWEIRLGLTWSARVWGGKQEQRRACPATTRTWASARMSSVRCSITAIAPTRAMHSHRTERDDGHGRGPMATAVWRSRRKLADGQVARRACLGV
jgi:hypothetical protein